MRQDEPKSKLTLWVGDKAKRVGKAWAKKHRESLSELVTNYLLRLETSEAASPVTITPLVQSLTGIISSKKDITRDYERYLKKKYLGS